MAGSGERDARSAVMPYPASEMSPTNDEHSARSSSWSPDLRPQSEDDQARTAKKRRKRLSKLQKVRRQCESRPTPYTREQLKPYRKPRYSKLCIERIRCKNYPEEPFRFLELPAELRVQIYEEHFLDVTTPITVWSGYPNRDARKYKRNIQHRLGLLRVCKAINAEATETYYKKKTFCFVGRASWPVCVAFFYTIGTMNYSNIQHLSLPIPIFSESDLGQFFYFPRSKNDFRALSDSVQRMGLGIPELRRYRPRRRWCTDFCWRDLCFVFAKTRALKTLELDAEIDDSSLFFPGEYIQMENGLDTYSWPGLDLVKRLDELLPDLKVTIRLELNRSAAETKWMDENGTVRDVLYSKGQGQSMQEIVTAAVRCNWRIINWFPVDDEEVDGEKRMEVLWEPRVFR
ncbi:hypothetical protein K402DRAFT_465545 [Aulographum hederae CBS 113979]|uniref:2EXR domain-containing protein n=1 Tax=Aulographum hederae CBS 113979 TaxID=1176131 RepID=A0A6G1GT09_9PEZI|nr:hypothetical protein K402DRAFT_465545 [Aulographum hederae CBS 113979]